MNDWYNDLDAYIEENDTDESVIEEVEIKIINIKDLII